MRGQAEPVAVAQDNFSELPEDSLKKAWPTLDSAFAIAAQDLLELEESQRRAVQEVVLGLLALWQRSRANPAVAKRAWPRRFLPESNSVVIFPPKSRSGCGCWDGRRIRGNQR